MHAGNQAQLRHDAAAVQGQVHDAAGLERVEQQQRGLAGIRRMGQHAARAHQQVDRRQQAGDLGFLFGRPALQKVSQGQANGLAGHGLFQQQILARLGQGERAQGLVGQAIPGLVFAQHERQPAQHVVDSGRARDVLDVVAHAQVAALQAMERLTFLDGHRRRRTADVDADDAQFKVLGQRAHARAERRRGRRNGLGRDGRQPAEARQAVQPALEIQRFQFGLNGQKVFAVHAGLHVVHHAQRRMVANLFGDGAARTGIARENDVGLAGVGPGGAGRRDGVGDVEQRIVGAALAAARQDDNGRRLLLQRADTRGQVPAFALLLLIQREQGLGDGVGRVCGFARALDAVVAHEAGDGDAQGLSRTGGRHERIDARAVLAFRHDERAVLVQQGALRDLLDAREALLDGQRHIGPWRFERGGELGAGDDAVLALDHVDEHGLRERAAHVGGEDGLYERRRHGNFRFRISDFRLLTDGYF